MCVKVCGSVSKRGHAVVSEHIKHIGILDCPINLSRSVIVDQ